MGVSDRFNDIAGECERRMEISRELGAQYIVAFPSRNDRKKYASIEDGLERYIKIAEIGRKIGVLPTIEFIGQTTQINNIERAMKFVSNLDKDCSKLVVDAFHLWRNGEIDDFQSCDIKKEQISILHVSDASNQYPRAEYRDRHRVMPGDGIIDLNKFFQIARKKQFDGYVSIGVYNKGDLNYSPYEVAKHGYDKLKYFLNS